mgnify:CR=1 FL=1
MQDVTRPATLRLLCSMYCSKSLETQIFDLWVRTSIFEESSESFYSRPNAPALSCQKQMRAREKNEFHSSVFNPRFGKQVIGRLLFCSKFLDAQFCVLLTPALVSDKVKQIWSNDFCKVGWTSNFHSVTCFQSVTEVAS